jgi:rhamnulose-1-phosphate aldolase/alcohol dehydrogenase
MHNQWRDDDATSLDPIDQLIYQARLFGSEPALVLWGVGNNSLKTDETDFAGRPVRVLRIKGSGSDMKAMQRKDYSGVRLDDLLPLMAREDMSDAEMVNYVAHTLLAPNAPRPSIETLLHAFIPHNAVLHTHADAILMLTNTPAREAIVHQCFGGDVITIPYRRPGFLLSREVGQAVQANPHARGLVLMNHGLMTWGATAKEAYDCHIELVTQAEAFVTKAIEDHGRQKTFASVDMDASAYQERRALALRITPLLRGLLSKDQRLVLLYDNSQEVLSFLAQTEAPAMLHAGAATPDHMLNTKRAALWIDLPSQWDGQRVGIDEIRAYLEQHLAAYVEDNRRRVAAHYDANLLSMNEAVKVNDLPRVIVMPGVGMWTAGKDMRAATVAADIQHHTFRIMAGARALGGYVSLSDSDAFHAEYWPLELDKLTQAPAEKELARRVALVTGAANGIGKSIALRLAAEGAHVVVTDIDLANAQAVADEIVEANGIGRAIALALDVTNEEQVQHVFDETVLRYGGLDVLVSNAGIAKVAAIADLSLKDWNLSLSINTTGHFLVSRAAMRVLLAQNIGGSLVFNATKNVTAPGKDFGAYSAAKAAEAQLCRILAIEGGPARIRANMVNPDAVLSSNLWSPEIREKRAKAQGIPVEQLEDFYTQRNLLKAKITGEDVAEAVFWLASDRSAKTTGAMIPVDGGVREAFPR